MIITCTFCHQTFDKEGAAWPGDAVPCPFCKMEIRLPKSETVNIEKAVTVGVVESDPLVLSPGGQEYRPIQISDDEVLPAGALLGQYRIEKFIGKGGMGAVYRATHSMLQRPVAIKVLPPKFARDQEFVARFKREAFALANLSHPNIVAIHDMGVQGEIYYFVMEFVDGVNLRDILVSKKLTPEQALKIVPQLCDALEYAHSKSIIHRDIKPENIMIDRSGVAKIADFGLAKIVKGDTATSVPLTQTNVVMGTIEYMAPEQREALKTVDHRVDIYSMGVVLYEMLTGTLPVGKFDPPSRKIAIDVRIDDVVLKALEAEPDRRYQHASQMGTEVTQVRTSSAPVAADWPIVDARSKKSMGTAREKRLALRLGDASLNISGWDRPEISIDADGGYDVQETVILATGAGRFDLHVPGGAEISVINAEGSVVATQVVGTLVVHGNVDVTVNGFDGRLDIVSGDGGIAINGLKSESVDLRSVDGDIQLTGLEFTRGRVAIEAADGDIEVHVAPASSFRYQAFTQDGSIEIPAGGSMTGKSASGAVGAGVGTLSLRSADGAIVLRTSGTRPSPGELFTPQVMEKLGVFAIVNVALWLFFVFGMGIYFPAICTTVFWGMAIALDLWKAYVRGSAPDLKCAVNVAVRATPAAAAPPPVPVNPKLSMWPIICLLSLVPTALALTSLGVSALFLIGSVNSHGMAEREGWIAIASTAFASLLTGAISMALGMATSSHLKESQGALRGRPLATLTTALGMVSVLSVTFFARPALNDVRAATPEVQAVGQEFANAKQGDDMMQFWSLVASDEQNLLPEFRAALRAMPADDLMRAQMVRFSPDRDAAQIDMIVNQGGRWLNISLLLRRTGRSWQVVGMKSLLESMKGVTNGQR